MAAESKRAIVAAIIGNIAIATIKFVAAGFTGSSAMISEGIHSVVDTGCAAASGRRTNSTSSATAWRSISGASSWPSASSA
jgi:hypothetical protein